ncbi:phage tail protein [Hahella sp. HN01]|uniref:phage tail protein n=1 Tax=Hahella sp. HN01 TaxID=2847262 RepID=UPI001C1EA7C5|nr:tail fiber protein [Hahella sp. HN01]MBU6952767.1 tail fiber protein [Hahella sp. HN01]
MSESFIGEIRIFAGNYAPFNWTFCNGQLLTIAQNEALFSVIGVTFGGDARTSFGLPDMRGRIPLNFGQGPGLTDRAFGSSFGSSEVVLTEANLPPHTHLLQASNEAVTANVNPTGQATGVTAVPFYAGVSNMTNLAPDAIGNTGGLDNGQTAAHYNMMPYLALNFILSLKGYYPSRN